jgi:hypothetical protein
VLRKGLERRQGPREMIRLRRRGTYIRRMLLPQGARLALQSGAGVLASPVRCLSR